MPHIVITKIQSMQQSLTVSENEIAQYVIHNIDDVVTSTITAMAKSTGTSEASINRFCKKIGYKGFNSFKIALAQESYYKSMNENNSEKHNDSLVSSVSHDYRQMLVNTSAMLDEDIVGYAANAINKAEHVYIFATPTTSLVAQEFEFKLNMTGIFTKTSTDITFMRVAINNMTADDLVIIIAPTVLNNDLYQILALCKDRDATIVTITSSDSPKLVGLSNYKFIISDKISTKHSVSLSNNLVYLYVIDVIYCSLLNQSKERKRRRLNNNIALSSLSATQDLYYNV